MSDKMQWSTDPELNAALELDAQKLADMGVEGYATEAITRDQAFERAAIVKYLRHHAMVIDGRLSTTARNLRRFATRVEKGEHHK